MTTIKSDHILLYCHFSKTIKGPGTSFQSGDWKLVPGPFMVLLKLSQKHVRNIFHTGH